MFANFKYVFAKKDNFSKRLSKQLSTNTIYNKYILIMSNCNRKELTSCRYYIC